MGLAKAQRLRTTLRALHNRNYRLFYIGQGISLVGTWMQMVATGWLVNRLTGSAVMLGVVAFANAASATTSASFTQPGVYTLRLTAVRTDKSIETAFVTVTVDHQPPSVVLTAPEDGMSFTPSDLYVTLAAEPEDNLQVSYVEFYVDRELFEVSEEWPYSVRWPIGALGAHVVEAIAYDAAGNSASSGVATIHIVEGGR